MTRKEMVERVATVAVERGWWDVGMVTEWVARAAEMTNEEVAAWVDRAERCSAEQES